VGAAESRFRWQFITVTVTVIGSAKQLSNPQGSQRLMRFFRGSWGVTRAENPTVSLCCILRVPKLCQLRCCDPLASHSHRLPVQRVAALGSQQVYSTSTTTAVQGVKWQWAVGRRASGVLLLVVSLSLDSIDSGFSISWLFLLRDISEWLASLISNLILWI
jgi:hypothetical protein